MRQFKPLLPKNKASSLLLVIIITSILAIYIQDASILAWQQKKIISLEKKYNLTYQNYHNVLKQVINKLNTYKSISDIATINYTDYKINAETTYTAKTRIVAQNPNYKLPTCQGYIIIEITIFNKFDYGLEEQYPNAASNYSKLHTYVTICEDEGINPKNNANSLKIFAISSINWDIK